MRASSTLLKSGVVDQVRGIAGAPWMSPSISTYLLMPQLDHQRCLVERESKGDREREEWKGLTPFCERLLRERKEGRVELQERRR